MQLLFVPIEEHDIELMLPLYNHYVRETTATLQEGEVDALAMRARLFPDYPRFDSWKIVVDGRPCGYVSLTRYKISTVYDATAEVSIFLDPAWPGKGVGTQALAFVEYRARERQFHSLIAVICAENIGSIRLFQKQGYVQCAHCHDVAKKFGRWLDVLMFEKLLSD